MSQYNYKKAIIYALGSVFIFSFMGVFVKFLSADYSVVQIVFFRCLFAFIPVVYLITTQNVWARLLTRQVSGHLSRSLIGVFSMSMGFASYAFLPLAEATVLGFLKPILLTMLAVPLLNEKVGIWRWSAVLIGFLGVVVMINPSGEVANQMQYVGLALGLCAAVTAALAMVIVKKLGETEPSIVIVFYFTLISTLCAAIFLPVYWKAPADIYVWMAFIGSGVCGGIGQILTTRSHQYAPAAIISPFNYLAIILAVIYGYLFFDEVPKITMLFGSLIVISSGLIILYREILLKKDPTRINPMSMQPARQTHADEAIPDKDIIQDGDYNIIGEDDKKQETKIET